MPLFPRSTCCFSPYFLLFSCVHSFFHVVLKCTIICNIHHYLFCVYRYLLHCERQLYVVMPFFYFFCMLAFVCYQCVIH